MHHPITGITTLTIAGETRTLSCDMNCAAVLYESKGERWPEWLTARFIGVAVEGGRQVLPLKPADMIVALHAALATDRYDSPHPEETERTLARSIGLADYADLQLALVRCVMTAFGVPGKVLDAVLAAMSERPTELPAAPAPGVGEAPSPSPSDQSASPRIVSGGSRSPSGMASSKATRSGSRPSAGKRPGKSRT